MFRLFNFFLVLPFLWIQNCHPPDLNNPCDPDTRDYLITSATAASQSTSLFFCGTTYRQISNLISATETTTSSTSDSASTNANQTSANAKASSPTFSSPAGKYTSPQSISISSTTSNAKVYYSIDGSNPSSSSFLFSNALPIWSLAGRTIRAIAIAPGLADSDIVSVRYSYAPMKTRQATTFTTNDDGFLGLGVSPSYTGPTAHPTFTNDFTTKDNATGLVWKSCSEGQSGVTCTGTVDNHTVATAKAACLNLNSLNSGAGFAGLTNWRLPTMKELTSLSDFSLGALTIQTTFFPNTTNFAYYSNSPYPQDTTFGWYVDYTNGNSYANNSPAYHARCVSSPPVEETLSLTDNGDGTITDNVTGLIWQKCARGFANDASCSGASSPSATWTATFADCSGLSLAGKTWRVPNKNELESIRIFTASTGASINTTYFPNTPAVGFWTSTTQAGDNTQAWWVNFDSGFNALSDVRVKTNNATQLRCVTN